MSEKQCPIPIWPRWLGAGGALPFLILGVLSWVDWQAQAQVQFAVLAYGACILSFVGALHWGFAMTANGLDEAQQIVVPQGCLELGVEVAGVGRDQQYPGRPLEPGEPGIVDRREAPSPAASNHIEEHRLLPKDPLDGPEQIQVLPPIDVSTPMSGATSAACRAMSPGASIPTSITADSRSGRSCSRVLGIPSSPFCDPWVLATRNLDARTVAASSLAVVLPELPPIAITGPLKRRRKTPAMAR